MWPPKAEQWSVDLEVVDHLHEMGWGVRDKKIAMGLAS